MTVTAAQVKELRDKTGAGMMDCKKALVEHDGDIEKSIDALRKKGLAAAAKKAGRSTAEGIVGSYIHAGASLGVMVEVNCETDFVARTEDFQAFVRDVAMHVAAANPRFIGREEVTADVLERERKIFAEQALESGKPENVVERIVEGKMGKYYSENCLLEQPFVKDPDQTIGQLLQATIGKLGENMKISRFARFPIGGDHTVAVAVEAEDSDSDE